MLFDNTELSTQFESRADVKLFSNDKVKVLNILQNPPAVMAKACGMVRDGKGRGRRGVVSFTFQG